MIDQAAYMGSLCSHGPCMPSKQSQNMHLDIRVQLHTLYS